MIKAIVFDIDGVLADTERWHWEAFNDALLTFDQEPLTWNEHVNIYKGMSSQRKLQLLCERRHMDMTVDMTDNILSVKKRKYVDRIHERQIFDSKADVLQDLHELGYKLLACTNNCADITLLLMKKLDLGDCFSAVVTRDMPGVNAPKPASDLYNLAVQLSGCDPLECLVVEDSDVGVEAARRAGTKVWKVAGPEDVNLLSLLAEVHDAQRVNVVVPAAGQGKRFSEAGYKVPKPLIPYQGKPMVQLVMEMFADAHECRPVLLMQEEQMREYRVRDYFNDVVPWCGFVSVDGRTEGAACTVLLAEHLINNDNELIVVNSDQVVDLDMPRFLEFCRECRCDGVIVTFNVPPNDPKWSFVRTDDTRNVLEVAEKVQISNQATAGVYYWRRGSDFVEYARQMITQDERVNGEFYVAPVYNRMIENGLLVKAYAVPTYNMWPMGTPKDFKNTTAQWDREGRYNAS